MNAFLEAQAKSKRELEQWKKRNNIKEHREPTPPEHTPRHGLKEGALVEHKKNQAIREAKLNLRDKVKAFTEFVLGDPAKAMEALAKVSEKILVTTPTDPKEYDAYIESVSDEVYKALVNKVKF